MKDVPHIYEPYTDYGKAIDDATTLTALMNTMVIWRWIANDAMLIVARMDQKDFVEFREGLALERESKFAGEAWAKRFAAITMPEMMIRVGAVAGNYGVPWGLAFNRMCEAGLLSEKNGVYYLRRVDHKKKA